jgi:phosphate transport system protein
MRSRFTYQMTDLQQNLARLGALVEQALRRSVHSFANRDIFLARQVIRDDAQLDAAQHRAEERAYTLPALQQPVAHDLRMLTAVVAIARELERIGDYACAIARRTVRLAHRSTLVTPPPVLEELTVLSQQILHTSLTAFTQQNVVLAQQLCQADMQVDALEDQVQTTLLTLAQTEPQTFEAVLDMLDVTHRLERTADRATNIGERVIYLVTGTLVPLNP